jgi:hypothetical protein
MKYCVEGPICRKGSLENVRKTAGTIKRVTANRWRLLKGGGDGDVDIGGLIREREDFKNLRNAT